LQQRGAPRSAPLHGRRMQFHNEKSSGDLTRSFVGGTMQQVEDGLKAKDGRLWLFVAADWAHLEGSFDLKPFSISKSNTIDVHVEVCESLLMCSCVIVMQGKQCGPLHLALVAHCREWLWSKTTREMSQRDVEGSGIVDYLNIMWVIDSEFKLYRNVTTSVGMREHSAPSGGIWDGFWYIYRRGETTPAYSHIGLDTSATLNNQKHVAQRMHACIERAFELDKLLPPSPTQRRSFMGGITRLMSKSRVG